MKRPYRSTFSVIHQVIELLFGVIIFFLVLRFRSYSPDMLPVSFWVALVMLCFASLYLVDAYRNWRGQPFRREAGTVLVGCGLAVFVLIRFNMPYSLSAQTPSLTHSAYSLALTWWSLWSLALIVSRLGIRHILSRLPHQIRNFRSAVILGSNKNGLRLFEWMAANDWIRIIVYGATNPEFAGLDPRMSIFGSLSEALAWANQQGINHIYLAPLPEEEEELLKLGPRLSDMTASVYLLPHMLTEPFILSGESVAFGNTRAIALWESPQGYMLAAKRVMDVVLAMAALLVLAPVFGVVAAAIKLNSSGPVIYKQMRYGWDGKQISVYKFRTMLVCEDSQQFCQATENDSRVTSVGRFLRRTSLDEIPQFYNVLQGSMSLVGPRPHPVMLNEQWRKKVRGYMLRHKVKPGITGLAQVNGFRGETDTHEKMEKRIQYDLMYIRDWSLTLDIKILYRTVWCVFVPKNAY
ncbi:undecaprenyl-phosphate glucose phosphotransferase [Desulfocurvibacter africanus]|uniref:undecaprenyl-phosphate glucose phosphotransferase n=1 Tax=Desulfocurvibacter africanus TaxID=873 RepID=UPI000415ECA0|nr:undecaprenyl-phosphate glucose phosphotransferase [Desulfocurvibacter africanus]